MADCKHDGGIDVTAVEVISYRGEINEGMLTIKTDRNQFVDASVTAVECAKCYATMEFSEHTWE